MHYAEVSPPDRLATLVHCYWELRTLDVLPEPFHYHALPDACVNLLFNQRDTRIAGVTALRTRSEVLDLGCDFHFVGIQFFPGVWQGPRDEIVDHYVGAPYTGALPLADTSARMVGRSLSEQAEVLTALVEWLMARQVVATNPVTARLLTHLDRLRSVADMAALVGLSPRQLQRTLRRATGLAPHDLLKVLRLQQAFRHHYLHLYADQAHFIHAFRTATGC
ncbi:MAG: AraC family transcriptional regulator, partial [Gemmatimonadaceae bacterium]|nr:AraC family transcriptional regulator [Gemmatimonadaceae bacterium]